MNLQPIIQSEVSQKDKYCILMHIYGIQKDGTDEAICRAANGDADIENRLVDTGQGGMRAQDERRGQHGNIHTPTCKTALGIHCMIQGAQTGAL